MFRIPLDVLYTSQKYALFVRYHYGKNDVCVKTVEFTYEKDRENFIRLILNKQRMIFAKMHYRRMSEVDDYW